MARRKRQFLKLLATKSAHSGRPPTPTRLADDPLPDAVLPGDEVHPRAPAMPAMVRSDPVAEAEWERVVPILLDLKVITERDQSMLATYCLALSTFYKLHAFLHQHGISGADAKGRVQPRPEARLYLTFLEQVLQFSRAYGFDPTSRSVLAARRVGLTVPLRAVPPVNNADDEFFD